MGPDSLSVDTALELLWPAILFALVMGGYTSVVFYLCQFMSRRDVFRFRFSSLKRVTSRNLALRLVLLAGIHIVQYILLFPLVAYLWFWMLILVVALLYNDMTPANLIVISMSVLTSVRVTAYFNEDLSRDISRILPFALLGIFLAQLGDFEIEATLSLLEGTIWEWERAFYYWVFVIFQESALRFAAPALKGLGRSALLAYRRFRDG